MASSVLAVSPFLGLAALACPIGMGAMMWFMSRGKHAEPSHTPGQQPSTLDELRREHERLGAQIDGLAGEAGHHGSALELAP
jgi:hypothetical protein